MLRSNVSELAPLELAEATLTFGSRLYSHAERVDALLSESFSVLAAWVKRPTSEVNSHELGKLHGRLKHLLALQSLTREEEQREEYFLAAEHHLDELVLHHLHYRRFLYILKQRRGQQAPRIVQKLRERHAHELTLLLRGSSDFKQHLQDEAYLLKLRQEQYPDTFQVSEDFQLGMDSYLRGALPVVEGSTASKEAFRKLTHFAGEARFFKDNTRYSRSLAETSTFMAAGSTFMGTLLLRLAQPRVPFLELDSYLQAAVTSEENLDAVTLRFAQEVKSLVEEIIPHPALARGLESLLNELDRWGMNRESYTWRSADLILLHVHEQRGEPLAFYRLVLKSILLTDDFRGTKEDKEATTARAEALLERIEVQLMLNEAGDLSP